MARRLIALRRQLAPLSAPLLRAWVEALALGLTLLALVWLVRADILSGERQNGLFIALLSATSWYGLRLRRWHGPWWREIAAELLTGLLAALAAAWLIWHVGILAFPAAAHVIDESGLMAITGVVLRAVESSVIRGEPVSALTTQALGLPDPRVTMFIAGAIAFGAMRGGLRLWQLWARLRRHHLLWSLTHSHMMLVVLGSSVFATFITIEVLFNRITMENQSSIVLSSLLNLMVPLLIIIGILTVLLLLIVLPPSLLLSYFAARQTTRRLQRLTEGATRLRQGDYGTRIAVEGEDEVAALQTDFNAMARDLERAMHDVQTERDNVAKLLRNRRELVASVSHELRTPVATLRGYTESLTTRWQGKLPDELAEDIRVMEAETLRLQRLLDDLFALSRAEVDELAINCQPTALQPVIQRIAAAAAPGLWQTFKVELVLDLPAELPPARVDEMRFEQVLHNLLRNAVRHTPPGGIVAITASAAAEQVEVAVKDTGEGIAPEHLPHIWDRFYRVSSPGHADHAGAGLGLALVKELAEAMDGSVSVSSTPGLGSTFTIRLPAA